MFRAVAPLSRSSQVEWQRRGANCVGLQPAKKANDSLAVRLIAPELQSPPPTWAWQSSMLGGNGCAKIGGNKVTLEGKVLNKTFNNEWLPIGFF